MIEKDNEIILYTSKSGEVRIDVLYEGQNIWLTQKKMALLFGVQIPAINKHLKNIFGSAELREDRLVMIGSTNNKLVGAYYNMSRWL